MATVSQRKGFSSSEGQGESEMSSLDTESNENKQQVPENASPNEHFSPERRKRILLLTHVNIVLYATCFWVQQSFLPYLATELKVETVWYGYLQTVFAVCQLAGGPLFGRYGDVVGARGALIIAFSAAAAQYLLLAMTNSVPMLFISRIPGLFLHAMHGGMMVVTDLSDSAGRADALAKLSFSYGIGMVAGPLVGGVVAKHFGYYVAALMASVGSAFCVTLVMWGIPRSTKRSHLAKSDETKKEESVFDIKKVLSLLKNKRAALLIAVKLFSGIPLGVFQSMFSMLALQKFGLPADKNGMLMSYIGLISMLFQGFGVGLLTKRFSDIRLLKMATIWLACAYFFLSMVQELYQLCVVLVPLTAGLTVKNAVISSSLTKSVHDKDTGTMLGLSMGTHSVIRAVSPTIGGYLVSLYGFPVFGVFGCCVSVALTFFLFMVLRE